MSEKKVKRIGWFKAFWSTLLTSILLMPSFVAIPAIVSTMFIQRYYWTGFIVLACIRAGMIGQRLIGQWFMHLFGSRIAMFIGGICVSLFYLGSLLPIRHYAYEENDQFKYTVIYPCVYGSAVLYGFGILMLTSGNSEYIAQSMYTRYQSSVNEVLFSSDQFRGQKFMYSLGAIFILSIAGYMIDY
jgi:MFS family permease